jgi:hypothetical protein
MPSQQHPIPTSIEYDIGAETVCLSEKNNLVKITGVKDVRFKYFYAQVLDTSEDGRAVLEIIDVRPWGMAAPSHVGLRVRVLHKNLAYLPVFEYYRPAHPAVVEYDRLNMSPGALENIGTNHRASGFIGEGDLREMRFLELPQGFLGASMYVDFSPHHAVPIAFVAGVDYSTNYGLSAVAVSDSLVDEKLPPPHFVVLSAPEENQTISTSQSTCSSGASAAT